MTSTGRKAGQVSQGGEAVEPDRLITLAEAAQVFANHVKWPSQQEEPGMAWFQDVAKERWFFSAAHQARRFGGFMGTAENRFDPYGVLEDAAQPLS